MKSLLACIILLAFLPSASLRSIKRPVTGSNNTIDNKPAENLFIITTDGFRWQEIFNGADSALINDEMYTPDVASLKMQYWATSPEERRKRLMPFLWNVCSVKGQLYGNRLFDNKVNVANIYAISYPGYNEIFTGNTDPGVSSNNKYYNPNINVLEYLDSKPAFKGKVAAFTSWDVFPYILNEERNGLTINSGYQNINETKPTEGQTLINRTQDEGIYDKKATRYDQLTFLAANEYIRQHRPRVVYLGLGETDEFAHEGRYDLYLEQANQVDKMIAQLWHWVQTTPGYKDNTTFIITTDHGRGSKNNKWTSHGEFIKGSSQTWLVMMGPHVKPIGEIKEDQQLYQRQVAQTIAHLVGEEFPEEDVAPAISMR